MVRTQVQLTERQYERIRNLSHRDRLSIAEVVRRLIAKGLEEGPEQGNEERTRTLLQLAGIGRSELGDLARRHDDYLAEDGG